MSNEIKEVKKETTKEVEVIEKESNKVKKKVFNGWAGAWICGALIIGGMVAIVNSDPLAGDDIALEAFEELPERDVVIVDKGIANYNEPLAAFMKEHEGVQGLHVYRDTETAETYAFVSGEKGMEPLTLMLYGVVDGNDNEVVIGYNYVEASPQFRHEVPSMLLRVDVEEGVEVTGRIVNNDEYEHYKDVLKRYEDAGFEPMSKEELEKIEDEEWAATEEAEATSATREDPIKTDEEKPQARSEREVNGSEQNNMSTGEPTGASEEENPNLGDSIEPE